MAAALLRHALMQRGLGEAFSVASAGIAAVPGSAAAEGAIRAMAGYGLPLSDHRSSPLSHAEIESTWMILTMTRDHKAEVIRRYPQATDRVYTLGEFAGEPFGVHWEVADPYGGSDRVYEASSAELASVVQRIAEHLEQKHRKQEKGATQLKVAFGCDHGGIHLREAVLAVISELGLVAVDFGTHSEESVDYPDFGHKVGTAVARGDVDTGIVVCGTGIGISIAANKVKGVRAALCSEPFSARMSREHNDANVLALGARVIGPDLAKEIVRIFLETPFGGGRHQRRVQKISALEE